ncbi:hypothetical protein L9F63_019026, partial [Diploptera punctata]
NDRSVLEPRCEVRGHRERTSAATHATDGRQHESTQPFRLQSIRSIRCLCTAHAATGSSYGSSYSSRHLHQPHGSSRNADPTCNPQWHGQPCPCLPRQCLISTWQHRPQMGNPLAPTHPSTLMAFRRHILRFAIMKYLLQRK